MDEKELLRAAASKANAFAELYRLHVTRVYRYHMAHVGIAKDAEDLTSQTFLAALEKLSSFRRSGSFAAWLMEIAVKKRLNDIRGNRRELPIDAVLYYQSASLPTDRVAIQRKEMEATSRALKQISPDHAAIILTFFCDLSSSEVSRMLKKGTATTRMLISPGIQELRTRSTLALHEENTEDQGTIESDPEDGRLAEKLTIIASQITPDPHFISELENTLVANHLPKTKWTFSLQQIASLAGWALLIATGVFLLNWRVIPNSASINPFIANTGNSKSTAVTEAVFGEVTSSPSPTVKATTTSLATLEYIVQSGDTCTYIADRFGVTINQLITVNDLNDTCDIWIDQILLIPITPTSTPQID
jgi:RNA polymerase sigma-70 factor (ECF subfamily)